MKKLLFLCMTAVLFSACKKSGCTDPSALNYSLTAEKDDGSCVMPYEVQSDNDAQVFNTLISFSQGDLFKSYNGIVGFDANDVILTYSLYETLGGEDYWVQIPAIIGDVNYIPEFNENNGNMYINTLKADGSVGSPWTSTVTLKFKFVLIKGSGLKKNPNLDLTNYEEVKKAFDL